MSLRAHKLGYYTLTAAGTIAASYYFNYLFFFLRDRFGFDNRTNLWVAAWHGAIYVVAAWQGGKFAERRGYLTSLACGFAGVSLALMVGAWVTSVAGTFVVLAFYTFALLLVWPALEALVTADEPPDRVPHAVGVYNLVWSGSAAIAYFTGGPLYDWLGAALIFGIPILIFAAELLVVWWLARQRKPEAPRPDVAELVVTPVAPPVELRLQPRRSVTFLRLAWLANPLSYVAIYTLFAVMPGVATQLGLSPTLVGVFCSVWLFARLATFAVLWQWTGWHYRFRWLVVGYLLLVAGFVAVLLAPNLIVLLVGQVVFGAAAGLAYYSSLFYSMDLSDTKAEHGGLHEAGIGLGICAGPAIGALSLHLFPGWAHAGAAAVTGLLLVGFVAIVWVWRSGPSR